MSLFSTILANLFTDLFIKSSWGTPRSSLIKGIYSSWPVPFLSRADSTNYNSPGLSKIPSLANILVKLSLETTPEWCKSKLINIYGIVSRSLGGLASQFWTC